MSVAVLQAPVPKALRTAACDGALRWEVTPHAWLTVAVGVQDRGGPRFGHRGAAWGAGWRSLSERRRSQRDNPCPLGHVGGARLRPVVA